MFLNDLHVWKTHEERVNTESFLTSSGEDLLQILWVSKVFNAEIKVLEKDLLKLFFPFFFSVVFSVSLCKSIPETMVSFPNVSCFQNSLIPLAGNSLKKWSNIVVEVPAPYYRNECVCAGGSVVFWHMWSHSCMNRKCCKDTIFYICGVLLSRFWETVTEV